MSDPSSHSAALIAPHTRPSSASIGGVHATEVIEGLLVDAVVRRVRQKRLPEGVGVQRERRSDVGESGT